MTQLCISLRNSIRSTNLIYQFDLRVCKYFLPYWRQIFSTPYYHPKSKPFVDHVFLFGILDGKIWFRNYQVSNYYVHVYP